MYRLRDGMFVSYQIKLDTFEGPLDLLLHLIEKEEMDIYDIEVSKITDQYLQYLHTMQTLRLDVTSEFLVMASTLLSIKSKMLLPLHVEETDDYYLNDDGIDPREELVQRLIEYKKYKYLSETLKEKELERHRIFTRSPSDLTAYFVEQEQNPVEGISVYRLFDALEKAFIKASYRDPLTKIEREEISVQEKMDQIIQLLHEHQGIIYFSDIVLIRPSRSEIVVTFLSILELMKQNKISCVQSHAFDDIVIHESPSKGVIEHGLQ